jgi:hypothetical protein
MEIKRNPKAPSNRRGWSTADDSTLIKMARGGATGAEIAKILGRTIMAVTTRKHTLHVDVRLKSSKGREIDVPKSISTNKKKKRNELPIRVISRTPIQHQVKVKSPRSSWSSEDDKELLSLYAQGNSAKFIGMILNRTEAAVTIRKSTLKKLEAAAQKIEDHKVDDKKAAMLLRMEKMRAAKVKNKNLPVVEKVASVPADKKEKIISEVQPITETDFDALSRIAKRTGATITVVFNK